jgi:S1-C subfamily serine protease
VSLLTLRGLIAVVLLNSNGLTQNQKKELASEEAILKYAKTFVKEKEFKQAERDYQNDLIYAEEKLRNLAERGVIEAQYLLAMVYLYQLEEDKATTAISKVLNQDNIKKNDKEILFELAYKKSLENANNPKYSNKILTYLAHNKFKKAEEYLIFFDNNEIGLKVLANQGNQAAKDKLISIYLTKKNESGLIELYKAGSQDAQNALVELYTSQNNKTQLKAIADTGNENAKKALEIIVLETGSLKEIKDLADQGNQNAKKAYEQKVKTDGSFEEINFLAMDGNKEAEKIIKNKINEAISKNNLPFLERFAYYGNEQAILGCILVIFETKQWEKLKKPLSKFYDVKTRQSDIDEVVEISEKILREESIKDDETEMAWSNLLKLADQGNTNALELCAKFLYRDDLIKRYRLQQIITPNYEKAEALIREIIKKDKSRGYFNLGFFFEKKNNFSEAYKYYDMAANCGNFKALKNQLILLRNGQGQASSVTIELFLRYMAQGLDDGSDLVWSDQNKLNISYFENQIKNETAEKLKIKANLKVAEIQKWKSANKQKTQDQESQKISSGTGFFVNKNGFILTAAHVIQDSKQVSILFHKNKLPANTIINDRENDIALLKVDSKFEFPCLSFSRLPPDQGDKIATFGYPVVLSAEENDVKFKSGDISSLRGIGNDPRKIRLNLDVDPGNSGGPLLDSTSKVIGVILSKRNWKAMLEETGELSSGISYAIKNEFILPILQKNNLEAIISFDDSSTKASESIVEVQAE